MKKSEHTSTKSISGFGKFKYFMIGLFISLVLITILLFVLTFLDVLTLNFPPFNKEARIAEKIEGSKTILTELYDAEMAYFAREGTFSNDPDDLGFKLVALPEGYGLKVIYASEYGFLARMWGNLDKDDALDIWEITAKSREPVHIYDDVENTGDDIDPEEPPGSVDAQGEASLLLSGIYTAELTHFAEKNYFSTDFDVIGFEPASEPEYYNYEIFAAGDYCFLARAWGNLDDDEYLDIWEITCQDREPVHVFDDVTDSGRNIDPMEITLSPEQEDMAYMLSGLYLAEEANFYETDIYSVSSDDIGFEPPIEYKNYSWAILCADGNSFVARAWGNLDDDGFLDVWEITEDNREPVHIANDLYDIGEFIEDPEDIPCARLSEARTILSGIYTAEEAYFAEMNTYSISTDETGFEPASEPKYYKWNVLYVDDYGFLAVCWGNLDEDPFIDVWIGHEDDREPFHLFDDLNDRDNSEGLSDYYDADDEERGIFEAFLGRIGMGDE